MEYIHEYISLNRKRILHEMQTFLAIPSVSSNPERKQELWRATEWFAHHCNTIGIPKVEILETDGYPNAPKTVRTTINTCEPPLTLLDSHGIQIAIAVSEKNFREKTPNKRVGGLVPIVADLKKILRADSVLLAFRLPNENTSTSIERIDLELVFSGFEYYYSEFHNFWNNQLRKQRTQ
ncbi:MAG: hypothetical protein N3A63_08155 [Bacteroidetes bacterium]|nr:hypothetical protein [Bacteroidota bacterium]